MNEKTKGLISRRLSTLGRDPRGSILFSVDNFLLETQTYMDTAWYRFVAFIWGVDLAASCKFTGQIHFRRYPGSKIRIGKSCRFRSEFRSNMIGINRPNGLSTHHKNAEILIGDYCGFSGVVIGAGKRIVIGDHVLCGANVTITDFDWHNVNPLQRNQGQGVIEQARSVNIGDNVWLGLNTLVLKGVEIGKNTVVGANSVVTSSLPENVLAAGVPARILRSLL